MTCHLGHEYPREEIFHICDDALREHSGNFCYSRIYTWIISILFLYRHGFMVRETICEYPRKSKLCCWVSPHVSPTPLHPQFSEKMDIYYTYQPWSFCYGQLYRNMDWGNLCFLQYCATSSWSYKSPYYHWRIYNGLYIHTPSWNLSR